MDERLTGMCAYCGVEPDTSDHVPSRVLLDEPYPPGLPVVDACEKCNTGFSLDEQYLSCFLECVICGTVASTGVRRSNIKRILGENAALQRRIGASQRKDRTGNLLWRPEFERIRKVLLKLARGHVAYELYPKLEEPNRVVFAPLSTLSLQERRAFEDANLGDLTLWPEIGTRAFLRASDKRPNQFEQKGDWILVQPGRYRYAVAETSGVLVRMVLSEYLACLVLWEH